jgi:hypothetical protein
MDEDVEKSLCDDVKDKRTQKRKKAETPITKDSTSWTSRLLLVSGLMLLSPSFEQLPDFIIFATDSDDDSQQQMVVELMR